MRKRIIPLILGLALLLAPAVSAFYEVESDVHNPETGIGAAVVHVSGDIYVSFYYVDNDGSGDYSPGDLRFKVVYFRQ